MKSKEEKELEDSITYEDLGEIIIFREPIIVKRIKKPRVETEMFEPSENAMKPKPKHRKRK